MTTLPKTVSGTAFVLLGILLALSPADALAAKHKSSVTAKRITLLREALVLVQAGETQLTGDRLRATLDIQQALTALGVPPTLTDSGTDAPTTTSDLKASLKKAKTDLSKALITISREDVSVASPVIGAILHLDKAIFLLELQERTSPSPTATLTTPAGTPSALESPTSDPNALSGPTGGEEVKPVQAQKEQSSQAPTPPPAPTTPTNTP
jgi:hypothetical protein